MVGVKGAYFLAKRAATEDAANSLWVLLLYMLLGLEMSVDGAVGGEGARDEEGLVVSVMPSPDDDVDDVDVDDEEEEVAGDADDGEEEEVEDEVVDEAKRVSVVGPVSDWRAR